MALAFAEIAFTENVQKVQDRMGSRRTYAKFLDDRYCDGHSLSEREIDFISDQDGFYQATVSESGWPYVQYRGGPRGFLRVLDQTTLAYADFRGNRQYLSVGNLSGNNRVSLILLDYRVRKRLKIWGEASIVEGDRLSDLITDLHDPAYKAIPERAVKIHVRAFDWNCPQHIPQRFTPDEWRRLEKHGETTVSN